MTQEELAEHVGVSIESISNMERGIHGPSFDNLEKIISVLQIPAKNLFEFDEWSSVGWINTTDYF